MTLLLFYHYYDYQLETIFERFFSSAECFKTEKIKAAFTKLLKLLFTTSSSAASGKLSIVIIII